MMKQIGIVIVAVIATMALAPGNIWMFLLALIILNAVFSNY